MPDLAPDIAERVKENSALLVPDEGPTGYFLAVTNQTPYEYEFIQGPRDEVMVGTGDPNGVHYASMGTLYVEKDAPALWQNNDGGTGWTQIGGSAGGGFPISYDDGTVTYSITATGGNFVFTAVKDADATKIVQLFFDNSGPLPDLDIEVANDVNFNVGNDINIGGDNDTNIDAGNQTNVGGVGLLSIANRTVYRPGGAVASGDLAASEFSLWLTDTPGATALNIKAKDSSGNVRTASIPLT